MVEASRMPGSGVLPLTGHQRDVMRESAHTVLSWLRANRCPSASRGSRVAWSTRTGPLGRRGRARARRRSRDVASSWRQAQNDLEQGPCHDAEADDDEPHDDADHPLQDSEIPCDITELLGSGWPATTPCPCRQRSPPRRTSRRRASASTVLSLTGS